MINGVSTNSYTASYPTLRSRQIARLKQMINQNQPLVTSLGSSEPVWKVLIFDKVGQNILSPLLTIKELRELGVTLHLLIDAEREPLPDVSAVYFNLASEPNISLLCKDITNGMYEHYYLNFISSITRPRLEDVAASAVKAGCLSSIQKVYDQYLNFISLEDDLFILKRFENNESCSYYGINRSDMTEEQMNKTIDDIVDALFAVFVTLGVVPFIRAPKGNAAELVAEKLDKKMRENLRDARNNLFTGENARAGQLSFQRPLLLIIDRSMDIATPLRHTWTYQALMHDVLDFDLNRVVLHSAESSANKKSRSKEYDLSVTDKLWMAQKGSPFPVVAEAVQEELDAYRSSEDEIVRLKHAMGLDAESDEAISLLTDTNAKLNSAVSSLPELLEKKRLIDLHMNVASAVLESIKTRKLDLFFEVEEKLMSRQSIDKPLIEILKDPQCGSLQDKLRLLAIYYVCSDMPENELKSCKAILDSMQCDTSALKYIKRWKSFAKAMSKDQYSGGGTKTVSMFSKLLNTSSQFVMEGVKNLVVKKHNLPLTRIVDAMMEAKAIPEVEDYRYFDPKLLRPTVNGIPHNKTFSEAVVFVIGGGTYVEYQNLIDYIKSKAGQVIQKKITYGCTELINATQFLSQLASLGCEF